jgi:peroxiredoxin
MFLVKGPTMTLMILAMVLPWLLWAVGFWLGYQLLLQSGRVLVRLEMLENQMHLLTTALEAEDGSAGEASTEQPISNGQVAKPGRGKTNKGLAHSRINRKGLKAGTLAPTFRLPRLDGGELGLQDYRGRQILLVFSDPECGPCEQLAPHLEEFHLQNPGIQVLMISRGEAKTNRKKAAGWGLTFPIVLQRQWEISLLYGMFATPIAYLIDEQGVLAADVAAGLEPIQALMNRAESIDGVRQVRD